MLYQVVDLPDYYLLAVLLAFAVQVVELVPPVQKQERLAHRIKGRLVPAQEEQTVLAMAFAVQVVELVPPAAVVLDLRLAVLSVDFGRPLLIHLLLFFSPYYKILSYLL
jgi:hypothetical protein